MRSKQDWRRLKQSLNWLAHFLVLLSCRTLAALSYNWVSLGVAGDFLFPSGTFTDLKRVVVFFSITFPEQSAFCTWVMNHPNLHISTCSQQPSGWHKGARTIKETTEGPCDDSREQWPQNWTPREWLNNSAEVKKPLGWEVKCLWMYDDRSSVTLDRRT